MEGIPFFLSNAVKKKKSCGSGYFFPTTLASGTFTVYIQWLRKGAYMTSNFYKLTELPCCFNSNHNNPEGNGQG